MMQVSTGNNGNDGTNAARRNRNPHLSITDENHHVTEAIGYMYDDAYEGRDSRRLSYIPSPQHEVISTSPINRAGAQPPRTSSKDRHLLPIRTSSIDQGRSSGQSKESETEQNSNGRETGAPSSPALNRSASADQNPVAFPLNDIDFESGPAAVAQELSNLAALRRMSMDVVAADPDLPSNTPNVPSVAPSSSADDDDESRLFWVPAHLHPGLAPTEFKSFLETKADQIKRRSGELSVVESGAGVDLQRQNSGGGLKRKKSLLSRQVDTPSHSASRSSKPSNLEALTEETPPSFPDGDKPILPPAPPGHSLRRSTRTTYRKGSLKSGAPYSRRAARQSDTGTETTGRRASVSSEEPPILGLTRVSTEPASYADGAKNYSRPAHRVKTSTSASDLSPVSPSNQTNTPSESQGLGSQPSSSEPLASQGQTIPEKPQHSADLSRVDNRHSSPTSSSPQQAYIPERHSSHNPPPSLPPQTPLPPEPTNKKSSKRAGVVIPAPEKSHSTADIAPQPSRIPSTSSRTDTTPYIPIVTEEKKPEGKKSKDKKDSEGGKKSSWRWRRGNDDKEKEKEKKREEEAKKLEAKASKAADKGHGNARLDVLQASIDGGTKGRESIVLDRTESKFDDDDRPKNSSRKSSGEPKKEKEAGLFQSIFGGSKKKHLSDSHKKHTRHPSPDPPMRILKPDIDYNWTRFSILEERAIYRMAHIKLANPRRALYSQVLLSNFMYSYLAKVQQMHPHMSLPTSAAQTQQMKKEQQQQQQQQPDEYTQYQKYQQTQEQDHYGGDSSYSTEYDYSDDQHDHYNSHQSSGRNQSYENGHSYGQGYQQQQQYNSYHSYGNDGHQDDDDDMW